MTWQRRALGCAAILAGALAASVLTWLCMPAALAWSGPAAAASRVAPSPVPGSGGDGSSDALVSLVVAAVLVGVVAWAALVLRGLSGQRRRSSGTPGRHRRAGEGDESPSGGENQVGEQQTLPPQRQQGRDRPGNQGWGRDDRG